MDPCYGNTMLVSLSLNIGMRFMNYSEVDEGYQSMGIILSVIPHSFLYGLIYK